MTTLLDLFISRSLYISWWCWIMVWGEGCKFFDRRGEGGKVGLVARGYSQFYPDSKMSGEITKYCIIFTFSVYIYFSDILCTKCKISRPYVWLGLVSWLIPSGGMGSSSNIMLKYKYPLFTLFSTHLKLESILDNCEKLREKLLKLCQWV